VPLWMFGLLMTLCLGCSGMVGLGGSTGVWHNGRSCWYGSHRERRMRGSIPAFDMYLPRQTWIGRSKAFYLIGMISRDVGKIALTVMWSSVLLLCLQNPAFCSPWTSYRLEKKSTEYLSSADVSSLLLGLAQYSMW